MKTTIKTIMLTLSILATSMNFVEGQSIIKKQIDSLKYLQGDPFAPNAITWKIIAKKKNAIQPLIDKLDDATITNATYKCKKTKLTIGDIAFITLEKILPLPFATVTGMQADVIQDGCQLGMFEYIESDRARFKQQVQIYYNKRKNKLK